MNIKLKTEKPKNFKFEFLKDFLQDIEENKKVYCAKNLRIE